MPDKANSTLQSRCDTTHPTLADMETQSIGEALAMQPQHPRNAMEELRTAAASNIANFLPNLLKFR